MRIPSMFLPGLHVVPMQPCLAGNARMAILLTISPAASSAENTKAALHFAMAAKKVVMTPVVSTDWLTDR